MQADADCFILLEKSGLARNLNFFAALKGPFEIDYNFWALIEFFF